MDEETIFLQALEQSSPQGRAAFLDRACAGNEALRRGVDLLLKAHGKAADFLDRPAAPVTSAQPSAGAGAVIGPYKLLQQIGEGGMGTVYLADQTQPLQRKVALKVIKPGPGQPANPRPF